MGARERLLLYRHTNVGDGQVDVIPQAVVAREDAMHLARAAEANGGKLRVRFAMPNKIGGPVEQMNVVGEIRGREKPDEAVILARIWIRGNWGRARWTTAATPRW